MSAVAHAGRTDPAIAVRVLDEGVDRRLVVGVGRRDQLSHLVRVSGAVCHGYGR